MKKFPILLALPILIYSQTTDNLKPEETFNKKLYAKGALVFGPGFESIKVGEKFYEDEDKDPEDINIMPGGGFGIEAAIGYDITKNLGFELSIGTQNSGSYIDEDNRAQFKKAQIRVSGFYRIPIEKKFTPYFGAGLSMILSAKYLEDSMGIESEVVYTKPLGFHVLGGMEWRTPNSPLFWYGEARFIILGDFEVDEADIADWIIEEVGIDTMGGNGLQFSFGIGYYIN